MPPLLQVENLSVEFRTLEGRLRAVDDLSFAVQPGRTLALIGESGSGKSVTAQTVLGLLPGSAHRLRGRILFRDPGAAGPVDLASLPRDAPAFGRIRGDRISMVFQEPTAALSPMHTIGEQIGDVLRRHRPELDRGARRAAALEALRDVGFPDPGRAAGAYSFQLSGGLCQRAMIAIAVLCRPALIIADEPTTALDVTVQAEILRLLRRMQDEHGTALLLISHDLGVVATMADEMVVMHHGAAMESGAVADLFAAPRHPYLRALMRSVPRLGRPREERLKPLREVEVADALAGFARRRSGADGATLMEARGLSRAFHPTGLAGGAPHHALRDVSIAIRRGECLGLVGESGSGKTTLSRILARDERPDRGTLAMTGEDGHDVQDVLALRGPALRSWRRRVQYVFQNPYLALDPRMSVEQILAEPLEIHGIGTRRSRRERARELLRLVGLPDTHLSRFPHGFSGGQRQRIGIARALALEPELILFDEPVSALDVSVQAQVLNLLADLRRELGLTYLFVSHNLAVVDYLATRIAVMSDGRVVEIAPRETLFSHAVHPYTRRLIASIPEPDPRHPIDFSQFGAKRERSGWGWPFVGRDGAAEPDLIALSPDHLVQAFEEGRGDIPAHGPGPALAGRPAAVRALT